MSPQRTQKVPQKSPVVRFIGVSSLVFKVVANCAVDVTMEGNTLLPITLPVLVATVFVVLRYFQHSGVQVSIPGLGERFYDLNELELFAVPHILVDTNEQRVVFDFSNDTERKKELGRAHV